MTSTMPAARAGAVAMIWALEVTVMLVAAWLPNFTTVAPVKAVPLIVTAVPPVSLTKLSGPARDGVAAS